MCEGEGSWVFMDVGRRNGRRCKHSSIPVTLASQSSELSPFMAEYLPYRHITRSPRRPRKGVCPRMVFRV